MYLKSVKMKNVFKNVASDKEICRESILSQLR